MFSTISTLLFSFIKGKKNILYILLGLIFIGLIGYGYFKYTSMQNTILKQRSVIKTQIIQIHDYKNQINNLKQINDENNKQLLELQKKYENNIAILQEKYSNALKRVKVVTKIKERIKYIKVYAKSKDAPTAPVLKETLDYIKKIGD